MKTGENRKIAGIIAGLRRREPVLDNPDELTDTIMKAILETGKENKSPETGKKKYPETLRIISRFLAAASVALFALFSYEQYQIVEKVAHLESQNDSISNSSQYHSALWLKNMADIISSHPDLSKHYADFQNGRINTSKLLKAVMITDLFSSHKMGPGKNVYRRKTEKWLPFHRTKEIQDSTKKK